MLISAVSYLSNQSQLFLFILPRTKNMYLAINKQCEIQLASLLNSLLLLVNQIWLIYDENDEREFKTLLLILVNEMKNLYKDTEQRIFQKDFFIQLICFLTPLLVHECSVRVDGLVVELAVLVLHGVDDVPPALQRQLDAQLGPPVAPGHHGLHLMRDDVINKLSSLQLAQNQLDFLPR